MNSQASSFRPEPVIRRLAAFPDTLRPLIAGLDDRDLLWRPSPGHWSITEILAHLALEESQDFRPRLRAILAEPQLEWEPIDPETAVRKADAHARGIEHWLSAFASQRTASIDWLRGLPSPDWSRANVHPIHGSMPASGLLGAWAAHDALHLRQIAKRLYQIAQCEAGEHEVGYAGSWEERGPAS